MRRIEAGFPLLAILSAGAGFGLFQALGFARTGGVFEYPLDDVYIHLAVAEQIAAGGYGINPGEFAAAASSPLYPFLLLPLGLGEAQRILPLLWNLAGLGALAFLWGRVVEESGLGRRLGLFAALLGPLALAMPAVAMLGMEHSLHAAASLAILLGLAHFFRDGSSRLLFAGLFLAPLLRYEGLALAGLAVIVLIAAGAWRRAGLGLVLAVLPLAGFTAFLMVNGHEPLPSSVMAKLGTPVPGVGWGERLFATLHGNLVTPRGAYLALLSIAAVALPCRMQNTTWRRFAVVLTAAGGAHLLVGQIGWLDRYEHYILVSLSAGLLLLLGRAGLDPRLTSAMAIGLLLVPLALYLPRSLRMLPEGPRNIVLQQDQMADFVQTHLKTAVAVNDIGRIAWRNPNPVLDLWGLASPQARDLRLAQRVPGWAGPLVAQKSVPAALIYDEHLSEAVGEDWVALGGLRLEEARGFLGGDLVVFYATGPAHVAMMKAAIEAWVPGLRPGSHFEWARAFR